MMQVDRLRASTAHDTHAGFVSRAIAFVIDLLVISLLVLLVVAFTQVVLNFFTLYGVLGRSEPLSGSLRTIVTACVTAIEVAVVIGYPVGCWVLFGRTPGKALMGLCVVRVDGKRLTVGRALLRFFGYWLSAIPLGLGTTSSREPVSSTFGSPGTISIWRSWRCDDPVTTPWGGRYV
jgi:uncharacterized RDD family membrane protein YckC